jgi:hypothetical protein
MSAHVIHRSFRVLALVLDTGALSFQTILAARVSKLWIIFVNSREEATAIYKGEIERLVDSSAPGVVVEIA